MSDHALVHACKGLLEAMDKGVDDILPADIADIVKFHSKGAAIAALGAAWFPGAGGTAAILASAGFIWSMYGRINHKIGLSLSKNILKSVAAGISTNLVAYAFGSVVLSTAFSLFPGLGSIAASALMAGVCYALTLGSGYVYLNVLTRVLKAGKAPSSLTAEEFKKVAKQVAAEENIKKVMAEAKKEFKAAKARGEIKKDQG